MIADETRMEPLISGLQAAQEAHESKDMACFELFVVPDSFALKYAHR